MSDVPDFLKDVTSLRDVRHIDKTLYLGSSPIFYEFNYNSYTPSSDLFDLVKAKTERSGNSWRVKREGVWTHVVPLRRSGDLESLPAQGWKIHVSATNINCEEILDRVSEFLVSNRIQFKFANDLQTLRLLTTKRWSRGGSGKFITIYPTSADAFTHVIEEIHQTLKGYEGSFILSDRRYKDSKCVYFRYGGIQSRKIIDPFGRQIEVLADPNGGLVIDRRNPYYELPSWIDEIIPPESDDPDGEEMTLCQGRFVIESALAFSNTGGVYLARDTELDCQVVIKEARPGVELAPDGTDARDRLAHEAELLAALTNSGITPDLIATFSDWENFYLVEEYLDAENMRQIMLDYSPLLKVRATAEDSVKFYNLFKQIFVNLLRAVGELHRHNIIIGDLSPMNILVNPSTLQVRIIDLEGAFSASSDKKQEIHTPGFRVNTKGRKKESDFGDDKYAVGVIMMYSLFPISAMAYLREDIFDAVLPILIGDAGWQKTPVRELITALASGSIDCAEAAEVLEESELKLESFPSPLLRTSRMSTDDPVRDIGSFIVSHWRRDPNFTLFPIDPFGQTTNPAGLFFGSSGIITALAKAHIKIPSELLDRYFSEISETRPTSMATGLITGVAGVAFALLELGRLDLAKPFIDHLQAIDLSRAHHSLYYGLAGIGLVNLRAHRSFDDAAYLQRAVAIAETLDALHRSDAKGVYWEDAGGVRIGLGYGQSGVALFLLRLSQVSGDTKWLGLGQRALSYDLAHAVELEPGVKSFGGESEISGTVFPYIEQGSAGIAKVAIRYGMWDDLDTILAAANRKYSGFPGLIFGLTGFVDVLLDAYLYSENHQYLEDARLPRTGLDDLYLFRTEQGIAAPGENLFRVSCDYATGLAGIMLTLQRFKSKSFDDFCLDWLDVEHM